MRTRREGATKGTSEAKALSLRAHLLTGLKSMCENSRSTVPAAKQFAEKVGSTATLGCALLAKWKKTEHRQECLCYKNASEMDFFRKLFTRWCLEFGLSDTLW